MSRLFLERNTVQIFAPKKGSAIQVFIFLSSAI